ncbi:hypothetical protein VPNG_03456 [Cytospora leucostoma]|uniref:Heme haloperoxidase family profile domain-containing protein n=1 Tax=Cytospora leucostoma TaxID=1230097 RepID=A0A423XG77_9PEZI|nr:hypothetical protein VPNG_03456 [Cytospora leucostoma]
MKISVVLAALAGQSAVLAFPWMKEEGLHALLNHPEARAEIQRRLDQHNAEKRDAGIIEGVTSLLSGTLEAVVDSVVGLIPTDDAVNGLKRFPEAAYPFKEPSNTDQRGPCPGLNTLANHGYIPRTGIATIGQIVFATQRVFNMEADLGNLLAVGGDIDGGDILSEKMSIGGPDNRVGVLNGALNSIFGTPSGISGHGKFNEGDASATREDFYISGDDITFVPEYFKQMHQKALSIGDGTYSVDVVKAHFAARYEASKAANKQFYFNLPSAAVVMGAYYFIPGFFSNGTIGAGGVANEASITSFYGAKPSDSSPGAWNNTDLSYTHVAERIPDNWYRRGTPMTIAEAVGGILDVYLYALPAFGGSGADDSFVAGPVDVPTSVQGFSCFLYNAIYANFPSELFNAVIALESVVNFVSNIVSPGYKALGCSVNFPDTSGTSNWTTWSETYVGKAKTQAVGSGWYKGKSNNDA